MAWKILARTQCIGRSVYSMAEGRRKTLWGDGIEKIRQQQMRYRLYLRLEINRNTETMYRVMITWPVRENPVFYRNQTDVTCAIVYPSTQKQELVSLLIRFCHTSQCSWLTACHWLSLIHLLITKGRSIWCLLVSELKTCHYSSQRQYFWNEDTSVIIGTFVSHIWKTCSTECLYSPYDDAQTLRRGLDGPFCKRNVFSP